MMKKIGSLIFAGLFLLFAACQSGQGAKESGTEGSAFHKIVVQEVLQASEYTYLHAKENNNDVWLAVPAMQAKQGDIYYYEGGITMQKFESKELNKVFESIILLEKINTEPNSNSVVKTAASSYTAPAAGSGTASTAPGQDNAAPMGQSATAGATSEGYTRKSPTIEKKEVKVEPAKGGMTIAKLFAEKTGMAGKTVKVRGQVTKYTPMVMGKNWIHIQDGTDYQGKFDLTVTSGTEVKLGDIVTLEGKIALDKDLGYGYFFDVLMEDAKAVQ